MRNIVARLAVLSLVTFGGPALAADKSAGPAVKPLTQQDLENHAGAGCTLDKGKATYLIDDLEKGVVRVDGKVIELKPAKADSNLSQLEKKGDTFQYSDASVGLTVEVAMVTSKAAKLTVTKDGKTTTVTKLTLSCGD
ncbi:hypothetical protein HPC49_02345 [Pyxidicoccus fallax]|uniref:Lipoprotein n=1 Tax=Pyxidicoccus fallax TaxID=394095 RepID=A0A848LB24_9BACT|nr:hypothetical protein [Pyxidicoccus fallax]NMO15686.1 hypothetical protein [Pyxidicoccus fallax]NPC77093.1 hypothetical protein [Pyxidicoccus fallax]